MLTIHQRAGEDGKLFGSVGAKEIVDAIREARDLRIDRRKVRLEQPIREIGTYMVEIELADGSPPRSRRSSPRRSRRPDPSVRAANFFSAGFAAWRLRVGVGSG